MQRCRAHFMFFGENSDSPVHIQSMTVNKIEIVSLVQTRRQSTRWVNIKGIGGISCWKSKSFRPPDCSWDCEEYCDFENETWLYLLVSPLTDWMTLRWGATKTTSGTRPQWDSSTPNLPPTIQAWTTSLAHFRSLCLLSSKIYCGSKRSSTTRRGYKMCGKRCWAITC